MMKRRSFLGVLAAAPLAGKAIAADMAQQTGIASLGTLKTYAGAGNAMGQAGILANGGKPAHEIWREAFKMIPGLRAEQESLLFETEQVSALDPDIAVYRSFSFNAKVAFQRQRNVAKRLDQMQAEPFWAKSDALMSRIAGLFKS